eukprot:EG_transcript_30575
MEPEGKGESRNVHQASKALSDALAARAKPAPLPLGRTDPTTSSVPAARCRAYSLSACVHFSPDPTFQNAPESSTFPHVRAFMAPHERFGRPMKGHGEVHLGKTRPTGS